MQKLVEYAKTYATEAVKQTTGVRLGIATTDDGIHLIGFHLFDDTKPCATYLCAVYDLETQGEVEVKKGVDRVIKALI